MCKITENSWNVLEISKLVSKATMLKLAIYFHNKATIVMQKGHLDKQNVKLAWFFSFEQVFPPKEQRCFSNSASKQKSIHIHWLEKLI